ncbi:MAG: hypothetical protein IPN95_31455 [Bacteroidetes bacterium]|nr:hypothetical protein [Bacteroidota bacterium]
MDSRLQGQNVTLGGDLTATTTITQDNAEVLRINNNGTAGTIIDLQNTGDLRVMDNGTNAFQVLDDGRVIIGTASQLSINNTGNITRLNNVVTNFPNAKGCRYFPQQRRRRQPRLGGGSLLYGSHYSLQWFDFDGKRCTVGWCHFGQYHRVSIRCISPHFCQ